MIPHISNTNHRRQNKKTSNSPRKSQIPTEFPNSKQKSLGFTKKNPFATKKKLPKFLALRCSPWHQRRCGSAAAPWLQAFWRAASPNRSPWWSWGVSLVSWSVCWVPCLLVAEDGFSRSYNRNNKPFSQRKIMHPGKHHLFRQHKSTNQHFSPLPRCSLQHMFQTQIQCITKLTGEQLLMYGGDGIEKVANDWCCVCVNPTAVTLCEPSMINGFLGTISLATNQDRLEICHFQQVVHTSIHRIYG